MKLKLAAMLVVAGCVAMPMFGQSNPGGYGIGVNLKVNCSHKVPGTLPSINAALKLLAPAMSNTVTVSGTCNENMLIQGFDRLTLISTTGATINDASGGQRTVVDIEDSRHVTLQGFSIDGGLDGVGVGNGSRAFLTNNVIKNNGTRGLTVNDGAQVFSDSDTFQDNPSTGVVANSGAYFSCSKSTVENNGNGGIVLMDHSTGRIFSCTISGNTGNGVVVQRGSEVRFDSSNGPVTVTANSGSGVLVRDLSFSLFSGGANITGNLGGTDVVCAPQFPATRGALTETGGGTTNCVE